MSPWLSFFGFYKSYFYEETSLFCQAAGIWVFALSCKGHIIAHKLKSQIHSMQDRDFYCFPFPLPSLSATAPFPAYWWSFSSVTCFPGITATDDTNDSPGFAIQPRGFCAHLNHGRGQRSNGLRETFMKIGCKAKSTHSSSMWELDQAIGKSVSKSSWPAEKKKTAAKCSFINHLDFALVF